MKKLSLTESCIFTIGATHRKPPLNLCAHIPKRFAVTIVENLGSNSFEPPDDGFGYCDCCHEGPDVRGEASCNLSPILEAAEHALDDVSPLVVDMIEIQFHLAMFIGWDNCNGSPVCQSGWQVMTLISLVANQFNRWRLSGDAVLGNAHIMSIAAR